MLSSTIAGATINLIGCLGWQPIRSSAGGGDVRECSGSTRDHGRSHNDSDRLRWRWRSSCVGLVTSLNHPGGNITGVVFQSDLTAKRLGLLHDLVPSSVAIAALFHPASPGANSGARWKAVKRLAGKS